MRIWTRLFLWLCLMLSALQPLSAASALAPMPRLPTVGGVSSSAEPATGNIAPEVQHALRTAAAGDLIPIIVTMKKQADLGATASLDRDDRVRRVVQLLQETANANQVPIRAFLATQQAQGLAGPPTPFWVFNGLAVPARAVVIDQLAARRDVGRISLNQTVEAPSAATDAATEPNIAAINAPALWALGYRGQGVVVANVDTGVYLNHDDLYAQWRGGTNSWYDPNNEHPDTPTDLNGHGTHTMGVMVGRDAGGTAIGVAPEAQWIAVKIFDDQGRATVAGIHAAYQWLLDPDGDPGTADAPHVVNNSWGFGSPVCDLEFQLDLQALRAANILPVFSAGNFGPSGATSTSPANNPEAFAVGAVDDFDQIYAYSSRGPSSCSEAQTVFPEIVAPGVDVRTTERSNLYTDATGTSLAAPHVAGALALLLSAYPQLGADEQASALLAGAVDLGPVGPDNDFGHGRLDVWAAYQFLLAAGPTPTLTPDPNVNLALDRPVTVSSFRDDAHTGDKAVDGSLDTLWQTAKAVGKKVLPSEWIVVDLGSSMSIGAVSLEWDANYAIGYTIETSQDGSVWSTVFSTASGDGGNDSFTFEPVEARYVKLNSTVWTSSSLRNWLREFAVYASSGPTPTATPTPDNPPTPTATPEGGNSVHVGDLDASSSPDGKRWDAAVMIIAHDTNEALAAGATVSGTWGGGTSGTGSCVTDSNGGCSIAKTNLKSDLSSVTFTVDSVSHVSMVYEALLNHDPDGDSDGTSISVLSP